MLSINFITFHICFALRSTLTLSVYHFVTTEQTALETSVTVTELIRQSDNSGQNLDYCKKC